MSSSVNHTFLCNQPNASKFSFSLWHTIKLVRISLFENLDCVPMLVWLNMKNRKYMSIWNYNFSFLLLRLSTWQRFSTDFYLTDRKSGLRAIVKAGSGCNVIPLVFESKLVNTRKCRILSPHLTKWLRERNLSAESRLLRLEEG